LISLLCETKVWKIISIVKYKRSTEYKLSCFLTLWDVCGLLICLNRKIPILYMAINFRRTPINYWKLIRPILQHNVQPFKNSSNRSLIFHLLSGVYGNSDIFICNRIIFCLPIKLQLHSKVVSKNKLVWNIQ
jgi:hypothetical protein